MSLLVELIESASIGASTPIPATVTLATGLPGPQGVPGDAATITVGSTTTLSAGSPATVTNSGSSSAAVLQFGIPQGQQGVQGIPGPQGASGVIYATSPLAYNAGTQTVSIDLSAYLTISAAAATYYPTTNPSGFITSSALSGYATQAWVSSQGYLTSASLSGYATEAWVSSQGYLTASALTPYLTSATAASTYQTISGMSAYLTTASAASTYQTQSGMAAYLTTASAASTYAPLARGIPAGGTANQVLSKVNGTDYQVAWTTPTSGSAVWGGITGTLSAQTDLNTALGLKANTASPTFTGVPAAPTAAPGTSTTQIATTAFVTAVDVLKANIASPTFTGVPAAPTATSTDNSTQIATTAFVQTALSGATVASTTAVLAVVRNETGATITKGTVVYINGAGGNKATIAKAQADAEATSANTYGIVQNDITNNNNGNVVIAGVISNINTSAFPAGTLLYLSPTVAGGLTSTKPSAPDNLVYIGVVAYQHVNQGTIQLRIANGSEISELHDVAVSGLANNDLLAYDGPTNLWKNKSFGTLDLLTATTAASTYQPIGSYITDAPSDGTPYVRLNGAWEALIIS